MDFTRQLESYRQRVERGIDELTPPGDTRPARLHEAMRYSLQAGGAESGKAGAKRLRPVLLLATADAFGPRINPLPAAVALECLHTYSLVHDDLPCMDDDELRRGRPTAHKQFDEPTALLAGDALLTLSFQLIARHYATAPVIVAALLRELADAAGSERLIGGQMEDLLAEKSTGTTADELVFIHHNKTAALIAAAFSAGAICGGVDEGHLAALRDAGRHLGLAFQIVDDILDATADTTTLGKTAGKDARACKATFVSVHGLDAARRAAAEQTETALASLRALPGGAPFLVWLAEQMLRRKN